MLPYKVCNNTFDDTKPVYYMNNDNLKEYTLYIHFYFEGRISIIANKTETTAPNNPLDTLQNCPEDIFPDIKHY